MTTPQEDIFTEPTPATDTLANLGPLAALAGIWRGTGGMDINPKADGPEHQPYIEHIELQPIDAQTNGPQLYYGLRYHTRIVKPDPEDVETLHDQVGYWLWEPATGTLIQTLTIPRGQAVLAIGKANADARQFRVEAVRGSTVNGISSNPFLEHAFRTERYAITVTVHDDGNWSYTQETQLKVLGQDEIFLHTDHNTLQRVASPTPNPTSQHAAAETA